MPWDEEYGTKVRKAQGLTDNERLRRAKKFNVATSTTSGLLGIGALGALGAKHAPGILRRAGSASAGSKRVQRIARGGERATLPLTAASLGVGGVGSLNFAAVQNREANKIRVRSKDVSKSYGLDFGMDSFHQGQGAEAVSKAYDPERNRKTRMDLAAGTLAAGGGASGLAAGQAWKNRGRAMKLYGEASSQAHDVVVSPNLNAGAQKAQANSNKNLQRMLTMRGKADTHLRQALKGRSRALGYGAASAGMLMGADQIRRYRNGRGRSYSERGR